MDCGGSENNDSENGVENISQTGNNELEDWIDENYDDLRSIGEEAGIEGSFGGSDGIDGFRIEIRSLNEVIFVFYGADESIEEWMSRDWFTMEETFSGVAQNITGVADGYFEDLRVTITVLDENDNELDTVSFDFCYDPNHLRLWWCE